ncbi:MAG: MFS transporter [Actinomycetes bacterium]
MVEVSSRRASVAGAVWATRTVFAGNGALFATWVSRLPAVRDRLEATEQGLGFALLCVAVGSLLAMPLSSRLISRFGDRSVIGVCVLVCVLAYPTLGLVPGLLALGAVLLVVGAGVGVWDVAMNVAGHEVEKRAGRSLMPGFHACWSLGTVGGAGVGALAARAGLEPALHFAVASVVVGAASLLAIPRLPDSRDADGNPECEGEHHVPARPSRPIVTDPRLLGLGLMTFCAAWAEGSANDWLALLLTDDRDATGAQAALGFAVFATAMTLGRVAGNRVVDTLGRVRALRWGATVAAIGVVLLLAVPTLATGYAGALLWGLGVAVAFPLAMSAAGETPGRGPAAIAMVSTIAYSGFLVGPPLVGTIAHHVGLDRALWVVVVLAVGMLVLSGTARPAEDR